MAKNCPKCERPNNERAKRCIYCGGLFEDAFSPAPEKTAQPQKAGEAATLKRKPPEAFLVVVSPSQATDAATIEAFAGEMNADPYTARQRLIRPAPWIARSYYEQAEAGAMVKRLEAMGVDSYLIKRSGLDRLEDRTAARGVREIGEEKLILLDQDGELIEVPYSDVFLIVRGRIREQAERDGDMEEETPAVSLGKMMMGPEDPNAEPSALRETVSRFSVRPRAGLIRWVMPGQSAEMVDLYRKSTPRSIRVVETEFDYSGLGTDMLPSGLLNFNRIVNAVIEKAPGVILDKSFNVVGYTLRETPKEDKVKDELAMALGVTEGQKKIFDNRGFFDEHSAMIYLYYLRAAGKAKAAQSR